MKKFLVVLMTLLFAAGAFAQDAAKVEKKGPEFKYGFFGTAYGVKGQFGKNEYDYSHIRVRPSLSVGNENVKGVVTFEIDQEFGADTKNFDDAASASADPGTDNKDVEVKHAYIEANNVLIPNLTLTAGLKGFAMPLVCDDDYAMAQASYDFGMGKAVFTYLKHKENHVLTQYEDENDDDGDTNLTEAKTNRDDMETYAFQLPIKAGFISIKPGAMYTTLGKSHKGFTAASKSDVAIATLASEMADETGGTTVVNYGDADTNGVLDANENETALYNGSIKNYSINISGEMDMFSFDATYALARGKFHKAFENNIQNTEDPNCNYKKLKLDADAFSFYADVKPVEMFKLGAFYTMYTGDSQEQSMTNVDQNNKLSNYHDVMDTIYNTCTDAGRLFIIDGNGHATNGGMQPYDISGYAQGLVIYGVDMEVKPVDILTLFAQYGYVKSQKDIKYFDSLGMEKKFNKLAQEVDFRADLTIAPATTLFAEYAYVKFGSDFKKQYNENYMKNSFKEVVFGMSTKI